MTLRALCGLLFLVSGCTIHVVEQPAAPLAPRPTVLVADAQEARPARRHQHEHRAAPEPTPAPAPTATPVAQPTQQPGRATPSSRSDLTPRRPGSHSTQPVKDKPLYTPFRSVGSDKVSSPLTAQPTNNKPHKVELPHN